VSLDWGECEIVFAQDGKESDRCFWEKGVRMEIERKWRINKGDLREYLLGFSRRRGPKVRSTERGGRGGNIKGGCSKGHRGFLMLQRVQVGK